MKDSARPLRSALYVPASNARALAKARSLDVDAVIVDLEDAVAPSEKTTAREAARAVLAAGGFGHRLRVVRINGLDNPWGLDDLDALRGLAFDALLLPKVAGPDDVVAAAARLPGVSVWAMVETPAGVLAAPAVAPRVEALVVGTNDLEEALGCRVGPDRGPIAAALQGCVLAARAAGIVCLDGVYNAFRDEDGLRAEAEEGRTWGFDGKTLIHPAQIAPTNEIFAPSEEAIDLARRQIEAYEAAGGGIAVLDGRIVENLHVETARRTLARADAIAAREG